MFLPLVTYSVIAACILMYIFETNEAKGQGMGYALHHLGGMYRPAVREGQWWRLLTAGFLHMSPMHLMMNLLVLYNLGPAEERLFGRWLFLVLLIGSIVMGNLFAYWMGSDHDLSAGLSGGLYGLMAAYIALVVQTSGFAGLTASPSFLMMLLLNVSMNFMPGVGWQAHLGGASFGILFTVAVLKILG